MNECNNGSASTLHTGTPRAHPAQATRSPSAHWAHQAHRARRRAPNRPGPPAVGHLVHCPRKGTSLISCLQNLWSGHDSILDGDPGTRCQAVQRRERGTPTICAPFWILQQTARRSVARVVGHTSPPIECGPLWAWWAPGPRPDVFLCSGWVCVADANKWWNSVFHK